MTSQDSRPLGPPQHALLFAWLAQEAERVLGPIPADDLIRCAVQRYGRERGGRMAQRAEALGLLLDWTTYQALGEWSAPGYPHEAMTLQDTPQWQRIVTVCPWNDAWRAEGLQRYGRFYCRDIDRALVRGYSPDMEYSVSRTLPEGQPCCEFVAIGYGLTDDEMARLEILRARLGSTAVMPWEYHLGHLYWTMRRVFEAHTGAAGASIAQRALATFEKRFGAGLADTIRAHESTDFTIAAT
ncbi:MAG: L-2-amino-thiazoline-4-carboxylic acid hydrolase [Anaerolineae bacterium]